MDPRARGVTEPTTEPPAHAVAAVWRGGTEVRLEQVRIPPLADGDLLVRIDLATVCGSDLHTVSGRRPGACPSVLGHEAVGTVVASGPTAPAAVGARVVWGVTVSCGSCDRCRAGRTAKCRSLRKVGHEALDSGWALSGGYASHIVLPAGTPVVEVPADLPDLVAAPAACATATVMAVLEQAGSLAGARVLVCGAGMLGLAATAAAHDAGAAEVVVSDLSRDRLTLAARFGATRTLLAPDQAPPAVDVALEFSGSSAAAAAALAALDVGGRLVLAGSVSPSAPLPVDPERVVRSWLTVAGVHNYEPRHLARAVDFLHRSTDRWPWADLVTAPQPLAELGRLLTDDDRREPRAAVVPPRL